MNDLEVRFNEEIKDYSSKFQGFTFRQWLGIGIIAIVCIPFNIWTNSMDMQTLGIAFTCLFAVLCGLIFFVQFNGLPFEKAFPYFKRNYLDFFQVLENKTAAEKIVETELKQQKAWVKAKNKMDSAVAKNPHSQKTEMAIQEFKQIDYRLKSLINAYMVDDKLLTKQQRKEIAKRL